MKNTVFLLFVIFCSACSAQVHKCEESVGNKKVSRGLYKDAFELLKGCEDVQGVSALTLGQLAVMYGEFGFGEFEGKEDRAEKVYKLYVKSAIKGNEDSIFSVISILDSGEPLLSLEPQKEKADCLREIVDRGGEYDKSTIMSCLQ